MTLAELATVSRLSNEDASAIFSSTPGSPKFGVDLETTITHLPFSVSIRATLRPMVPPPMTMCKSLIS
jgi:hypothetical protein